MGMPAANGQSMVVAVDTHIVMVPSPGGPVPTPLPHPFNAIVDSGLINAVKICGQPAAVKGSIASNQPPHIPTPPGTAFQKPPSNKGEIFLGSMTVAISGQQAARHADAVKTCNDPADLPVGQVIAAGTVFIG